MNVKDFAGTKVWVGHRRYQKVRSKEFVPRLSAPEFSTTRTMTYGGNRMLRLTRHDASLHPPAVHDHGGTIVESHRSRRTRDQARKAWYAYYRQVRFARWFGLIRGDASLDPKLPGSAVNDTPGI